MQRRQLMPAFAYRQVKGLYPIFWQKSIDLADALSGLASSAGCTEGVVVEISRWLARTTLDIIGVAGLGADFRTIQDPDHEIMHAYSTVFDQKPPKSKATLLALIAKEMVARALPFKRNDVIAQAAGTLKRVARRLIQQKQAESQDGKATRKDVLSVALDSDVFTEAQMADQLLTFLAAGHETTATSMTWACLALCQHPNVQAKLRAEVRASLPSTAEPISMTADLLDSLQYLHAVCNEVLRLHPPAGLTKRVAVRDTFILGQRVPKGTDVMIVMRSINHSKELWGEDARKFKPERWLQSASGGAENNYAFMTFLHGKPLIFASLKVCIADRHQGRGRASAWDLLARSSQVCSLSSWDALNWS